jgi:hypothetical protein
MRNIPEDQAKKCQVTVAATKKEPKAHKILGVVS